MQTVHQNQGAAVHAVRCLQHGIRAGGPDRDHDPAGRHVPTFKLIPNGPLSDNWFCKSCGRFFDVPYESQEGGNV
jgi:hypothetical protein